MIIYVYSIKFIDIIHSFNELEKKSKYNYNDSLLI